jgi:hypothetical protein
MKGILLVLIFPQGFGPRNGAGARLLATQRKCNNIKSSTDQVPAGSGPQ